MMPSDDEYVEMIKKLEYIVAKHCSTLEGKHYRYPVHYIMDGEEYETRGKYLAKVTSDAIPTMEYSFGAHTLEIGQALEEIVEFINDEYGIFGMYPTPR